jgi:alcohol dehydrogenase class IV
MSETRRTDGTTGPSAVGSGAFWYLPMDVVRFGPGSLEHLPAECDRIGGSRVFLITVPELSGGPVAHRVRELLADRLVGVFDGVRAHVPYPAVMEAIEVVRAADADLLVSFGGGSAIDLTRAVALAMGERAWTIEALESFRARYDPAAGTTLPPTSGRSLPHVAIPTTLAAAEFANAGAVTSPSRRVKDLLIADELTPRAVIHDSDVGATTPVDLWSSAGHRRAQPRGDPAPVIGPPRRPARPGRRPRARRRLHGCLALVLRGDEP